MTIRQFVKKLDSYQGPRLGGADRPARKPAPAQLANNAAGAVRWSGFAHSPWLSGLAGRPLAKHQAGRSATSSRVRVLIYSEEPILAAGFERLIKADPGLELLACCSTIADLKRQLAEGTPDVTVVDFTSQITPETLFELQGLASECKLVLWANALEGDWTLRALRIGISGILRKSLPLEAHRECLHRVNSGDLWFERRISDSIN